MMMLGEKIQGSASKISHANMWRLVRNIVLALILAKVTLQVVTGEEERISNGQIPRPGKYPAIGRLVYPGYDNPYCLLSILNRDWLVAPAACFTGMYGTIERGPLTIVVGDEIYNETEPYEQVVKVERFIIHHRHQGVDAFSNKQTGDDIAVVKVTPPIKFSNRVTASNLPTCKDFEPGIGMVVGYGFNFFPARHYNHRLMEITSKIISTEECRKLVKWTTVDDRVLCVQAIGNMSACFADWGAPVYLVKSDYHMVLQGFMSRYPPIQAGPCGFKPDAQIALFTRISSYVGWIHRRISGCGNHPWYNMTEAENTPEPLNSKV